MNNQIDLEGIEKNAKKYRLSLADLLRQEFKDVQINMYGSDTIEEIAPYIKNPKASQINIFSLLLNTNNWGSDPIEPNIIDQGDLSEEVFYTQRRCNNSRKFDPRVFNNLDSVEYRLMAEVKAAEYRKQGEIIDTLNTDIFLIDELPPQLKSRFFFNVQRSSIPYLTFPWIRKEDPWRR